MGNEVEHNLSIFRECVSGALIQQSLTQSEKKPIRRRALGTRKKTFATTHEKLQDEDDASDLAEFSDVWLRTNTDGRSD